MIPSILTVKQTTPLVITLVGAGGKTSTAFWLAREFKQRGHSVLVSTTTKMFYPEKTQADDFINGEKEYSQIELKDSIIPSGAAVPASSQSAAANSLLLSRLLNKKPEPAITFCYHKKIFDSNTRKNKVIGISPELVDRLKSTAAFSVYIIEADGAKRLPLKAPAGNEPCVPSSSDIVIGIIGAEVIHTPAAPELIHRWSRFSTLTQCSQGDEIDHRILGNLLAHPQGMFKQAPEHAIKIWLINKVDLSSSYEDLTKLAQMVVSKIDRLDAVWLASMRDPTPIKKIVTR